MIMSVPIAALVIRSLGSGSYARLFAVDPVVGRPISAVGVSLLFATIAMVLAVVIGLISATIIVRGGGKLSSWFDVALMLPLGTSAVTIGFGFIVALDWPIDIRASLLLVPIAHALVAMPFVVRSTVPTLRAIDPKTREAAAALGASPARVWRHIDLPIVSKAALVGAAFSFVISLGEFGATAFIARPGGATIPIMIYRLLTRPGQLNFGMAMALSVVLAALTTAIVLSIDRARLGDIGRF
jgi:thiamine transport system permease protein